MTHEQRASILASRTSYDRDLLGRVIVIRRSEPVEPRLLPWNRSGPCSPINHDPPAKSAWARWADAHPAGELRILGVLLILSGALTAWAFLR